MQILNLRKNFRKVTTESKNIIKCLLMTSWRAGWRLHHYQRSTTQDYKVQPEPTYPVTGLHSLLQAHVPTSMHTSKCSYTHSTSPNIHFRQRPRKNIISGNFSRASQRHEKQEIKLGFEPSQTSSDTIALWTQQKGKVKFLLHIPAGRIN